MKHTFRDILLVLAAAILAAIGGGGAVLAGIDDAPGGVFLGLLLVLGAAALTLRTSRSGPRGP